MFQTLLICFREGLEAFLIIAIASTCLRRSDQGWLLGALRSGTAAAVLLSVGLGVVLSQIGALSPAWEGTMALVAAATVITCTVHMLRAGPRLKGEIARRLEHRTAPARRRAWWGVALFALFMVGREGVETATILASLAANAELRHMAAGGLICLLAAAAIAWAWTRQSHRIDLQRFFQVTSVFMVLFSVQLVIYALHEFTEGALVPGIDNAWWHLATEDIAEGTTGQLMSMGLVVVPIAWLAGTHWLARSPQAGVAGR